MLSSVWPCHPVSQQTTVPSIVPSPRQEWRCITYRPDDSALGDNRGLLSSQRRGGPLITARRPAVMHSARRSRAMGCHHAVMGVLLVGVRGRAGHSGSKRRDRGGLVCCCCALSFSCCFIPAGTVADRSIVRAGGRFDPPHGYSAVSRARPRDRMSSARASQAVGLLSALIPSTGGTCERFDRDRLFDLILIGRINQSQQQAVAMAGRDSPAAVIATCRAFPGGPGPRPEESGLKCRRSRRPVPRRCAMPAEPGELPSDRRGSRGGPPPGLHTHGPWISRARTAAGACHCRPGRSPECRRPSGVSEPVPLPPSAAG
jgi:hypothetical protein